MTTPEQRAANLRAALRNYETGAILAEIAGVMTRPENAAFGLRLGRLAELSICDAEHAGKRQSQLALERLCNGVDLKGLCSGEDPAEYPLTEPVAFGGRVYSAFTGQGEEEGFRSERFFQAIGRVHLATRTSFTDLATGLVRGVLDLSDDIAHRAGVRHGEPVTSSAGVVVPPVSLGSRVRWDGASAHLRHWKQR
jgi:hypothetical protein